jgi:xanthosine utilization system XapX-like protein
LQAGPNIFIFVSKIMSSISFSEVADLQISKYTNIGAFAILIFDFSITFQDEVKWTWSRPWDITRVIFAISRYLPFIGSGLTVYAALRVSGPPPPSLAENIIHIIGIIAAEGLLVIRTWAFWQKSKRVLIGLVAYGAVTIIAAVSMNVFPNHQLISADMSTLPGQGGFESSRNAALVYAILALFECVILALTVFKKFSDYRQVKSSIITTVYGGSMFYMLCIIAITVTNVIIDAVFPLGYTNMFDTLQVVIHSVLSSRIMFHLRSSHDHIYERHTSSMLMISEVIQYEQPWQMQTDERRSNASSEV